MVLLYVQYDAEHCEDYISMKKKKVLRKNIERKMYRQSLQESRIGISRKKKENRSDSQIRFIF